MINFSSSVLVTIYIPTYNRADLLSRALQSVFNQTIQNLEVIVVNDASTDNTAFFLENLKKIHKNLIVIHNQTPLGACKSRNIAIMQASGKYITGLDDDDEFLPNRIETLIKQFNPDTHAFICSGLIASNNFRRKKIDAYEEEITLEKMLYRNIAGNQILTTTHRLQTLKGFDESLASSQDYELWVRVIQSFGKGKRIKDPLYIMHDDINRERISNSNKRSQGIKQFLDKYQPIMTQAQITYKQILLSIYTGEANPCTFLKNAMKINLKYLTILIKLHLDLLIKKKILTKFIKKSFTPQ